MKPKKSPKPTTRLRRRRVGPRVQNFRDGSAVILDEQAGIVGMIEARPRYRVTRRKLARKN